MESVGNLVGADVVREQARDDFKGVLRMIDRSNCENHAATKTAKTSLRMFLLKKTCWSNRRLEPGKSNASCVD